MREVINSSSEELLSQTQLGAVHLRQKEDAMYQLRRKLIVGVNDNVQSYVIALEEVRLITYSLI